MADRDIARLNIDHFRRLLAGKLDDSKRQTILRLLAEEEAQLRLGRSPDKEADLGLLLPWAPMSRAHVHMCLC
jgi:hypothetical protein